MAMEEMADTEWKRPHCGHTRQTEANTAKGRHDWNLSTPSVRRCRVRGRLVVVLSPLSSLVPSPTSLLCTMAAPFSDGIGIANLPNQVR